MSKFQNEKGEVPTATIGSLEGLFRGLGNVIRVAADLVDKGEDGTELARTGVIGNTASGQGIYGLSIRVGPTHRPAFRKPATLRRQAVPSPSEDFREPPADLFDEGDYFLVVAELPALDESAVQWHISGDVLRIEAAGEAHRYYKELQLPSSINEESVTSAYKNGILELRLWKR